jgi:hypothetical protein
MTLFQFPTFLKVTKLELWHFCAPHLAKGSFLPKNQMLQEFFFDICNAEIAHCCQKLDVILVTKLS